MVSSHSRLSNDLSDKDLPGDIIFAKLFHKPAIIINSLEIARDLLEKRSVNYSDRPAFVLLEE